MKEQIKSALIKLKEYGWKLVCVFPKGYFDDDPYDDYEIDFERSNRDSVSLVILNGITLSITNMEAVERDYADLAHVQFAPDELILFLDICNAVKDLSDEDTYNVIMEGVRSL